MKLLNKVMIPLLMALIGLGVVTFMLPFGVAAHQAEPNQGEKVVNPQTHSAVEVLLSSSANGRVPEVAANNSVVAAVFVESNQVYLRAAITKWGNKKLLDTTNNGNFPKVALSPVGTNTVHIVWTGASGGIARKAIRHIKCTITEPVIETCGPIITIASTSFSTTTLEPPDIVVDSQDRVHVAWVENTDGTDRIRTVLSATGDSSFSTPQPVSLAGTSGGTALPVLATAGSRVYLAFIDRPGGVSEVEFRRSNVGAHSWTDNVIVNTDRFKGPLLHATIRNLTLAAGGSNVYMAWDVQHNVTQSLYGLVGITNTNSGLNTSWAASTRDITSSLAVGPALAPSDRLSKYDDGITNPTEEFELRPSAAMTNSNDFVVVWQQRPNDQCPSEGIGTQVTIGNGTSEIFRAETASNAWSKVVIEDDQSASGNITEYKIDPDVPVSTNGNMHLVFMRASGLSGGAACAAGGATGQYAIYYLGPITERFPENEVYLPTIRKVSL